MHGYIKDMRMLKLLYYRKLLIYFFGSQKLRRIAWIKQKIL